MPFVARTAAQVTRAPPTQWGRASGFIFSCGFIETSFWNDAVFTPLYLPKATWASRRPYGRITAWTGAIVAISSTLGDALSCLSGARWPTAYARQPVIDALVCGALPSWGLCVKCCWPGNITGAFPCSAARSRVSRWATAASVTHSLRARAHSSKELAFAFP